MRGLEQADPPAFRLHNEGGRSDHVLICEHASRFIPARYDGLGLPEHELKRHIAWDIGAEDTAIALSHLLDAPLLLANYSRLLIDLNRPPESEAAIPIISELTEIPGNANLSPEERQWRLDHLFHPFHCQVAALLDARAAAGRATRLVTVHSFTPVYKGVTRPMHAGVLFRKSEAFGRALVTRLGGEPAHIVANEPYQIEDEGDYAIPVHGEARGLDCVLLEIRQDLISDPDSAGNWATRIATALQAIQRLPA